MKQRSLYTGCDRPVQSLPPTFAEPLIAPAVTTCCHTNERRCKCTCMILLMASWSAMDLCVYRPSMRLLYLIILLSRIIPLLGYNVLDIFRLHVFFRFMVGQFISPHCYGTCFGRYSYQVCNNTLRVYSVV